MFLGRIRKNRISDWVEGDMFFIFLISVVWPLGIYLIMWISVIEPLLERMTFNLKKFLLKER